MTPKYKCLASASFQLLYTCWAASHEFTRISHSRPKPNIHLPLPSIMLHQVLSELMASPAFLYCPGENSSSDSSLSIDSWYLIIKSIHLISTIILSCVSSLPFPFVLLLFFIFYPDSYIQQIIPEHLPQARHKLYTLETRKWTKQTKFLPSRSFHSGQGVQTLNK